MTENYPQMQPGKPKVWHTPDHEYAVWLVPTGKVQAQLQKQISSLSRKYGAPDFEPHVTLVGLGAIPPKSAAELEDRLSRLAGSLAPFAIRLADIMQFDMFFRSIVVAVEPTPKVMKAGEIGRRLYREIHQKEPAEPKYFPHLSLMYSNLSAKEKQPIIAGEFADFGVDDKQPRFNISFKASTIELRDCSTQDTRNWRLIKEFRLARPEQSQVLETSI